MTDKIIQELASKLGTTSEYLWSVLIKQAPIDSTVTLIQYVIIGLAVHGLWKVTKAKLQEWVDDDFIPGIALTLIAWLVLGILVIVAFCSISQTVSGFINPEYWALDKVLSAIKGGNHGK